MRKKERKTPEDMKRELQIYIDKYVEEHEIIKKATEKEIINEKRECQEDRDEE